MEHISELINRELLTADWNILYTTEGGIEATKRIEGYAPAGSVSNGARVVTITMDYTGRWLTRVDGWGKVEAYVDLRNYSNNPKGAINTVLGMEQK